MSPEDAIKGIMTHRERIHRENAWANEGELSDIALKLATYNSYLADHLATFHRQATDKHHAVYLECLEKAEGVTKAEAMARGESTAQREEYEKAKFIYSSTESLMSRIQTKIRVLENQMKREGSL